MTKEEFHHFNGLEQPIKVRFQNIKCIVEVTADRFIKMLGRTEPTKVYIILYEVSQSIECIVADNEPFNVEGLLKMNRIANKEPFKNMHEIEDYVIKTFNSEHDFLEWTRY